MKKKIAIIMSLLLLFSGLLSGCKEPTEISGHVIYYLNLDGTTLVKESCEPKGTTELEQVEFYLDKLKSMPSSGDYRQTIPTNVSVLNIEYKDYLLTLDFSKEYKEMSVTDEVLVRAAIVRTMMQVSGVSFVLIKVEGKPLTDANGNYVGSMSEDSFLENPGAQINSSIETTLTLYFANQDGTGLCKETRKLRYSSNISMEKLVMEQLIDGPKDSHLQSTVPSEAKIISITAADGICYITFTDSFKNQNESITEDAVLFSIVNSLTELPNIDKVQISINGDISVKVRYLYPLSTMYERNDEIVFDDTKEQLPTEETTESTEVETKVIIIEGGTGVNAGVSDALNPIQ